MDGYLYSPLCLEKIFLISVKRGGNYPITKGGTMWYKIIVMHKINLLPLLEPIKQFVFLPISTIGIWFLSKYYWPVFMEWKKLKSKLSSALTVYANVYPHTKMVKDDNRSFLDIMHSVITNKSELSKTHRELRKLAGELRGLKDSTIGYTLLAKLKILPDEQKIERIAKSLVGWADSIHSESDFAYRDKFMSVIAKHVRKGN